MENTIDKSKYAHINGWGIDADEKNNPTYPMKKFTGDDYKRINYEKPAMQNADNVEILHSNERPGLTAVFGTSTPPMGISGAIRRYAFKFSEGSWGHWLPLIVADRINVVEGIIDDLKHGHIPNIMKERGWTAEWKYNKQGVVKKAGAIVAVSAAVVLAVYLLKRKRRSIV